jgi:hypothetical protein
MPIPPVRADPVPIGEASAPGSTVGDQRLDDALQAATSRHHAGYQAAMQAIEVAVCAVVDELRARGLGPEKVLVAVKARVAAQAAARSHDVLEDVVRWCIARYYDGDTPGAGRPPAPGRDA